jgi:hypothetical protein
MNASIAEGLTNVPAGGAFTEKPACRRRIGVCETATRESER